MAEQTWEEIKEAFQAALSLNSAERQEYLGQLLQESPALHEEVSALLSAHDEADQEEFLGGLNIGKKTASDLAETIAIGLPTIAMDSNDGEPASLDTLTASAKIDEAPPLGTLGDYQLLERIGRGGMGVVYKAFDPKLRRVVALKVIAAGSLSAPEDIARFHIEAEAAGRLDHPGIVPVYEVGEYEGTHYYSMALVEGESLAKYVGPRATLLPPRRAAELMEEVARAVQYAHDRAIIHRDLKPANILLDLEGHPRLTDFGLAKVLREEEGLTMTGQVMGTPNFMAPEQAKGQHDKITNRTDVYSLGATLYALLSGAPPFTGKNLIETLRKVESAAPEPLAFKGSPVPLDLWVLCEKCLSKRPEDRYESAGALADDLRNYLSGFPISARALGWSQRLSRWCQRNPAIASLVGTIAATLLVATAVSLGLMFQARAAQAEAEWNLHMIESVLDEALVSVSENDLADVPGTQLVREKLLSIAQRYYLRLQQSGQGNPEMIGRGAFLLGRLQNSLGQQAAAAESLDQALEIQEKSFAEKAPAVERELALAETHLECVKLGERVWNAREPLAISPEARDGVALMQPHAQECVEHRTRALALDPTSREVRRLLASAQMTFALAKIEGRSTSGSEADLQEAHGLLQVAQVIRQELLDEAPGDGKVMIDLAKGYVAQADLKDTQARAIPAGATNERAQLGSESLELRQSAIKSFESLPHDSISSQTRYELALCYQACGTHLEAAGKFELAIEYFEKMGLALNPLLMSNPAVYKYRKGVADAQYNLAQTVLRTGDIVGLDYFLDCQKTLANALLVDPHRTEVISLLNAYSETIVQNLVTNEHFTEALECLEQAKSLLTEARGFVADSGDIDREVVKYTERIEALRKELEQRNRTA